MSSKFRLALAGLTAAALIGGVMTADPADVWKKKKHKKVKIVKVKKGKSVKQVSKGGDAKAGNGGSGGSGGSSGNVYNTGNVNGGGVAPGTPGGCVLAAFDDVAPGGAITDPNVEDDFLIAADACGATDAQLVCLRTAAIAPGDLTDLTRAEVIGCVGGPGAGTGGGSVFSGDAGDGGAGGDGGNATGGTGGNNTNTSTVTVSRDDHSIDVDA